MGNKMDKVIFPTSDYIEINPPTKSICGSIASFSDGGNAPIPSLTASIVPVQDLHGYDRPWAGGAGKNKINITLTYIKSINKKGTWNGNTYTFNGLTYEFEANQDDCLTKITVNGTASTGVMLRIYYGLTYYLNGTYIVSGVTGGSDDTYQLEFVAKNYSRTIAASGENTLVANNILLVELATREGVTVSNLVVQPMVRLSTEDSTFAPYSNICPISGWTGCNPSVMGKNLYDLRTNRYMQGVEKLKVGDTLYVRTDYAIKYKLYIRYSGDSIATEYTIPENETVTIPLDRTVTAIALSEPDVNSIISNNKEFTISLTPIDNVVPYNGITTPIQFVVNGETKTIYSGYVEVINGKVKAVATDENIASYNGETLPSTWISDRDVYTEGTTPTIGAQVVYKLATPIEYDLADVSILSQNGENNVRADTGDVCVTYVTQEYQDLTVNFAATASKLGSSNVGSATQPIYLNGGTATACTYTLGKSVPSDAVFTDTNTNVTQTATSTNANYEVLFSGTADNTTRTEGARKDDNLRYNPSSNILQLRNTGTSTSITPSSISLSNSSGGGISIDNTNNKIEVGKSGTSITYSNTDIVTSNGNTWDGTNTSLKDAIANIIDLLHPVGSIYMSLTDSTVAEVEAKFGGTWEKIEDRFLLAASSSYAVDSTGGSADAVVVSHTHPLNGTNAKTSDQAAHTHPLNGTNAKAVDVGGHTHTEYAGINEATSGLFTSITGTRSYPNTHIIGGAGKTSSNGGHGHSLTGNTSTGGAHSHTLSGNTGAASDGVSGTGKNMPPYLAVYMYKRTA